MKNKKFLLFFTFSVMLAFAFASITLIAPAAFAAGLEGNYPSIASQSNPITVIFSNTLPALVATRQETALEVIVPTGAVDGEITVQTDDGVSNGALFEIGDSETPWSRHWVIAASGVITANTTWDQDVLVTGDVQVASGVTLTITPGVTVYFAEGDDQAGGRWNSKAEIIVFGTLQAEGSKSTPIFFTSSSDLPAAGSWGGIAIRESSTTSVLKYVVIQYATYGLHFWRPDNIAGSHPFAVDLHNSVLQFNEYGVVEYARPGYPGGGSSEITASIRNNLIRHNLYSGIHFLDSLGYGTVNNYSVIENNILEANDTGIYLLGGSWWQGHADNKPEVRNNTLRNNIAYGMNITAVGSSDTSSSDSDVQPVIEHNLFQNPGAINIGLLLNPMGSDGTQILSPVIRYNTIADAATGILIADTQSYDTLNPTIDHNIFYEFEQYAIQNLTSRLIVAEQNYWGYTEAQWDLGAGGWVSGIISTTNYLDSSSAPLLTRLDHDEAMIGASVDIYGANFISPTVTFSSSLAISPSVFGLTQLAVIVPDGAVSGNIVISAADGTSNELAFTPAVPGSAVAVSGPITTNTTWNQDMLVTGDVEIASGVTLTITPGVTVYFAEGDDQASGKWSNKTELIVRGTLQAQGSKAMPIYFTSNSVLPAAGDWGGIVIREGSTTSVVKYAVIQHATHGLYFWRLGTIGGDHIFSAALNNSVLQFNEYGVVVHASPGYPAGGTSQVTASISNNLVRSHTYAGIQLHAGLGFGTVRDYSMIQNNLIEANDTGMYLNINTWWMGHAEFRPEIRNNTFRNNFSYGLDVRATGSSDGSGSDTNMQPIIEHNLFRNPEAVNIGLWLHPMGSDGTQILSPVIRYNTIADAATGILIDDEQDYDTLNPTIDHNIFYGFDLLAIQNLTNRPIVAEQNYWGHTEAQWDLGAAGWVTGTITTTNYLDSSSAPLLTRVAPGLAQEGDHIQLYGANFGTYRLFLPLIIPADD